MSEIPGFIVISVKIFININAPMPENNGHKLFSI